MQKIAVYNLVVFGTASLLTTIAIITLYHFLGWPRATAGLGFMGISGFAGFSPFLFKKGPEKVTCDERDVLINRTATLCGFAASYLWFCLAGTAFVMLLSPELLKRFGLPLMILGGMFVVVIVHSIMIFAQYGRSRDNDGK